MYRFWTWFIQPSSITILGIFYCNGFTVYQVTTLPILRQTRMSLSYRVSLPIHRIRALAAAATASVATASAALGGRLGRELRKGGGGGGTKVGIRVLYIYIYLFIYIMCIMINVYIIIYIHIHCVVGIFYIYIPKIWRVYRTYYYDIYDDKPLE